MGRWGSGGATSVACGRWAGLEGAGWSQTWRRRVAARRIWLRDDDDGPHGGHTCRVMHSGDCAMSRTLGRPIGNRTRDLLGGATQTLYHNSKGLWGNSIKSLTYQNVIPETALLKISNQGWAILTRLFFVSKVVFACQYWFNLLTLPLLVSSIAHWDMPYV
jgi:hypothetical protein